MDGGSTDNSVEIITRHAKHLAFWVSEKDNGFGDAINKGFSKATGEIFCWLNSDDLLLPGALLTIGKYFMKYKTVGLVFGNRHVIDINSSLLFKRNYFFYFPGQFRYGKTLPQESTFWRRSVFVEAGPVDENLTYAIDFDLWCRISKIAIIRHIPFYIGAFRKQPLSKSAIHRKIGIQERDQTIIKYFKKKPASLEQKLFQFLLGLSRTLYRYLGFSALKQAIISGKLYK